MGPMLATLLAHAVWANCLDGGCAVALPPSLEKVDVLAAVEEHARGSLARWEPAFGPSRGISLLQFWR